MSTFILQNILRLVFFTLLISTQSQGQDIPLSFEAAKGHYNQDELIVDEITTAPYLHIMARLSEKNARIWWKMMLFEKYGYPYNGNPVYFVFALIPMNNPEHGYLTYGWTVYEKISEWVEGRDFTQQEKQDKIMEYRLFYEGIITKHLRNNGYNNFALEWKYLENFYDNSDDSAEVLLINTLN